MSKMKLMVFEYIQNQLLTNPKHLEGMTTKTIAESMGLQRSNVSSLLNKLVAENKLKKSATRPVLYTLADSTDQKNDFDTMVGAKQSLKNAIQLAKAAVLYPQNSLNILIHAQPGCGTSFFVETLVDFARHRHIIQPEAPFIKINCRNYSKDPHILDEKLFGPQNDFQNSAFDHSWTGILLIESYDSLTAKQQAKILEFLNHHIDLFKENKNHDTPNHIMVILSSSPTKDLPINQTIPFIIELPELEKRTFRERFDFINHFFSREAAHSKRTITVSAEVIRALLLSSLTYHIKELKMLITQACANGYVRVINDEEKDIDITISDFKPIIRHNLLKAKENTLIFEELFGNSETIIYDRDIGYLKEFGKSERLYLYEEIGRHYRSLSEHGITDINISSIMNKYIQNLFNQYSYYNMFDEQYNSIQLAKIVDPRVIQLVNSWLDTCSKALKREFKPSVFYGLCLHINSLLTLTTKRHMIPTNETSNLIQTYPEEYAFSVQLASNLNRQLQLDLPTEEIILILLFLIDQNEQQVSGHPVILYILHGSNIAKSLAETTNLLTQTNNIYSYDMTLDCKPQQAMTDIKELVERIDQGQGVIVIYDMGSIKTIVEAIAEELNCKIRLIYMPITLIGIEAARKSAMETDIDYVYHSVSMSMNDLLQKIEKGADLIITLCHTGEGGAEQLKHYIQRYSKLGMKIKALAISSRNELIKEVASLKKVYKIHAFVGTFDPNLFGIPFISIGKVFENTKENLDRLLMFEPLKTQFFDYTEVYQYLTESFKYTDVDKLKMLLPEVIDEISLHDDLSPDQTIGLFMHIACLVERLLEGNGRNMSIDNQAILKTFKPDRVILSKILKKIERSFAIIVNDAEISTIILIIKKL